MQIFTSSNASNLLSINDISLFMNVDDITFFKFRLSTLDCCFLFVSKMRGNSPFSWMTISSSILILISLHFGNSSIMDLIINFHHQFHLFPFSSSVRSHLGWCYGDARDNEFLSLNYSISSFSLLLNIIKSNLSIWMNWA